MISEQDLDLIQSILDHVRPQDRLQVDRWFTLAYQTRAFKDLDFNTAFIFLLMHFEKNSNTPHFSTDSPIWHLWGHLNTKIDEIYKKTSCPIETPMGLLNPSALLPGGEARVDRIFDEK